MVYTPTSSEDESEKDNTKSEKEITNGAYLLIKVAGEKKTSYKYVGIAQSGVEDEYLKVLFLHSIDSTKKNFKVQDDDISYIKTDEIITILPNPCLLMKGRSVYYNFNFSIDVAEK